MPNETIEGMLGRLERSKTVRDGTTAWRLPRLIRTLDRRLFPDAASIIRFHEALLFYRAFPHSPEVLRAAESTLRKFGRRVSAFRSAGGDAEPLEEPEVSGIAGAGLTVGFSYETTHQLHKKFPGLRIDWENVPDEQALGRALPRFLPLLEDDSLVEAHVPYREWIQWARPRGSRDLAWLLESLERMDAPPARKAEIYESLGLLLRWELGNAAETRTRMRTARRNRFFHNEPLLARRDVSLAEELGAEPLPVVRLPSDEGRRIVDLALATSAVRFRELHGFTFGDPSHVWRADAGRGLDIYVIGALPAHRLPIRAYHGAVFVKNGVPIGYFEGLSLFERMEVGFNLYYTFREGESAWLFARTLRLLRQMLGVTCFSMDPYQIGHQNEEAIESGAFWFYRKLGFRPIGPDQAALVAREEHKLARRPGYRTPPRTLRRLAESHMVYEAPGTPRGDWDRFQVRNLGLAVAKRMAGRFGGDPVRMRNDARRAVSDALGTEVHGDLVLLLSLIPDLAAWSEKEKAAVVSILRAKRGTDESRYLLRMQKHPRLRSDLLRLGAG